MIDEIPAINDLLDIYEDDPEWNVLQTIFNELHDIVVKCLVELTPFLVQETKFLPDDRHYILLYLFRTKRIFESIILLLIYKRYAEAKILERSFLENIVDTKIFLQSGTILRNKRKIKLYHLLNEKRRYELYIEDYNRSKEEHGFIITSVAIKKMNETLEQTISEGLKRFKGAEISKMESKVKTGSSWHGCKPKEAFKRCGMENEYEDYNMACTFVHIRDWPFPAGLLPVEDIESLIQFEFNSTLARLANHLNDFVQYCPNTFSDEIKQKKKQLTKNLFDLQEKLITKIDPEVNKFIGINDLDYE